jgi:hypothetical protein
MAIQTNKVDQTVKKIEAEITLMDEYRTALINEVVTGKVCVIGKRNRRHNNH